MMIKLEAESNDPEDREPKLQFIKKLEELELLWNNQHRDYPNRMKRYAGYAALLEYYRAEKEDATIDDVRKKINSLRTSFRSQHKKVLRSLQPGLEPREPYQPNSWTYYALKFLLKGEESDLSMSVTSNDGYDPLATTEEIDEYTSPVEDSAVYDEQSFIPETEMADPYADGSLEPGEVTHSAKRKKLTKMDDNWKMLLSKACACESLNRRKIPAIAVAWGEQLESLSPSQKPFAIKAINDILFEASQKKLEQCSISINNEPPMWRPRTKRKNYHYLHNLNIQ